MTKEQKEQVEKVMEGWQVGYAYLYPSDGSQRKEYVFDMTAENIANFIGKHLFGVDKIVLTDMRDRLILNTYGCFINQCPNQEKCLEIIEKLAPIQTGVCDAKEIVKVDRNLYEEYCRLEEQAVMEAELSMM